LSRVLRGFLYEKTSAGSRSTPKSESTHHPRERSGRSLQFTELRGEESCANQVSRRIILDRTLSLERMLVFEACFRLLASRS
jgi:hypothetical protein